MLNLKLTAEATTPHALAAQLREAADDLLAVAADDPDATEWDYDGAVDNENGSATYKVTGVEGGEKGDG